jgi:hypothetical protein
MPEFPSVQCVDFVPPPIFSLLQQRPCSLHLGQQCHTYSTCNRSSFCYCHCCRNRTAAAAAAPAATGPPACQLLLEDPAGQQVIGLKAGGGMDYVMYTVDEGLAVGELMEQHASKTPEECMAACATNGCELVSLALPNMPDLPGLVRCCAAAAAGWVAVCLLYYCCSRVPPHAVQLAA